MDGGEGDSNSKLPSQQQSGASLIQEAEYFIYHKNLVDAVNNPSTKTEFENQINYLTNK